MSFAARLEQMNAGPVPVASTVAVPDVPDDTLVFLGGEVKALGQGKVGGCVIPFGGMPDKQGDIFDPHGDYGLSDLKSARVVWHHGIGRDPIAIKVGNERIGTAILSRTDSGVWAEAQLDMDKSAVSDIYDGVCKGDCFWSSGSTERLVRRERSGSYSVIKTWPLVEISLTANPVNRANRAIALKAIADGIVQSSGSEGKLVDRALASASDAKAIAGRFAELVAKLQANGHDLHPVKREAIQAVAEAYKAAAGSAAELLAITAPPPDPADLRRQELLRRLRLASIG